MPLAGPGALGLADDVALIDGPPGEQYVLTTDTIIEGVDYLPADPPPQIARKLLRVNLSDLAAKGATPFGYLLSTALPEARDEAWLEGFAAGLAADQREFAIVLLGGDSSATPGPATLSATLIGRIGYGKAVLRSGAKPGDLVFVSGTLGDAALGLAVLKSALPEGLDAGLRDFLIDRYRVPRPRVGLGCKLVGLASAMIDLSDGLMADLRHLCDASKVGARIEQTLLPLSAAGRAALSRDPRLNQAVIGGGDDYELLFTAPAGTAEAVAAVSRAAGVAVTVIGRVEKNEGIELVDAAGNPVKVGLAGYKHF